MVISADSVNTASQVLVNFLSTNKDLRHEAQMWLESTPLETSLVLFLRILRESPHEELRGLAGVLIRNRLRAFLQKEDEQCSSDGQSGQDLHQGSFSVTFLLHNVAPELLECFIGESKLSVEKRLCGTIAYLMNLFLAKGRAEEWTQVWQLLNQWLACSEADNASEKRLKAFMLLNSLAELPATLTLLETHRQGFVEALHSCFASDDSMLADKVEALRVVASIEEGITCDNAENVLLSKVTRNEVSARFQSLREALRLLAPPVAAVLKEAVNWGQMASAVDAVSEACAAHAALRVELLQEAFRITESDPFFWGPSVSQLFSVVQEGLNTSILDLKRISLRIIFSATGHSLRHAQNAQTKDGIPSPATEMAECLLTSIAELIRETATRHIPCFGDSDEEWMEESEEGATSAVEDSNCLVDVLLHNVESFMTVAKSKEVEDVLLRLAVELLSQQNAPIPSVVGLRLLALLADGSSKVVLESMRVELLTHLTEQLQKGAPNDMRVRWWTLTVMASLLMENGPELQRSCSSSIVPILASTVEHDPIFRCKCRALTALVAYYVPLECDSDAELVDLHASSLIEDVVLPTIQNGHPTLQQLGLTLAASIVEAMGESFTPYYHRFMAIVEEIVSTSLQKSRTPTSVEGFRPFLLCEEAIDLGTKVLTNQTYDRCETDFHRFVNHVFDIAESLLSKDCSANGDGAAEREELQDYQDTALTLFPVVFAIGRLAEAASSRFVPYCPRVLDLAVKVLQQSDAVQAVGSDVDKLTAQQLTSTGVLGRLTAGHVSCVEAASGVTQVHVKGRGDEDHIFEFKTQVIEDKSATCDCLKSVISAVGEAWTPFAQQTADLLLWNVQSPYSFLRQASLQALPTLASIFVPGENELDTPLSASQCPLATGRVASAEFFMLMQHIIVSLLQSANAVSTTRAAAIYRTLEEVFDIYREGAEFSGPVSPDASETFVETIFTEFGKRMVVTLTEDIRMHEHQQFCDTKASHASCGQSTCCSSHSQKESVRAILKQGVMLFAAHFGVVHRSYINIMDRVLDTQGTGPQVDAEETGCCGTGEEEEEDPEGIVYCAIFRSMASAFTVYGPLCVRHFFTHLHTPFTALLTLPDASMRGRVAALCAYGVLLEYGDLTDEAEKIAKDILPLALLYARPNAISETQAASAPRVDGSQKPLEKSEAEEDDEDELDADADRTQAACYTIGVIAQIAPAVFNAHLETCLHALKDVTVHPRAKEERRCAAGDCAFGAFVKIYLNPAYSELLPSLGFGVEEFAHLVQEWFPIEGDDDEARKITDILADSICSRHSTMLRWLSYQPLREALVSGFRSIQEKLVCSSKLANAEEEEDSDTCDYRYWIKKETRLSGKLDHAIRVLLASE